MTSPSEQTNQFLSAALGYAERGWRVFPLVPRDKAPMTKTGFKEATTNRNRILEWWQLFPDANIGLATGDPFDVLDLDGPTGVPALRGVLPPDFRHTGPVVLTGKGWHFYYAAVGAGNRAGLLGDKIDYRGVGGYVVAPPSVHPSGRIYKWADDGRDASAALQVVPDGLQQVVIKPAALLTPSAIEHQLPGGRAGIVATQRASIAAERPDIIMVAESLGLGVFRKGAHYVTNCVFHDDPGPSMVLYIGQNKFFCYGCEARGDSHDLAAGRDMTGRVAVF